MPILRATIPVDGHTKQGIGSAGWASSQLGPMCPTRYFLPRGNLGPKQKGWWGWPSYTQSLSSIFNLVNSFFLRGGMEVRVKWGWDEEGRVMIHMKDPPGSVKHNKWRSIIQLDRLPFQLHFFLLPKHRGFFFFCMYVYFFACMSENIFIFLLLLNDYLAW